jgi:hypothetical protein
MSRFTSASSWYACFALSARFRISSEGIEPSEDLALIPLKKLFSGTNDILVYKEKSSSAFTDPSWILLRMR